jgi:hypothetical protein
MFEISHVNFIKKMIEAEKIDCDFTVTRTCNAWMNQDAGARAKAAFEKLKSYEMPYMEDVCFTAGKTAEGVCTLYI